MRGLAIPVILLSAMVARDVVADVSTSIGPIEAKRMASGLDEPWAIAFLPPADGGALITERGGRLWYLAPDGDRSAVTGVPKVRVKGQGGLLDVVVARDFSRSREIFLTYAAPQGSAEGTALAVARLSRDRTRLTDVRRIFESAPGTRGGRHFGSRVVEGADGRLFVTIGDRGNRDAAQDLARHNGKVVRINRDGTVPDDNPFADTPGARPEVWSLGHRNPQGAALDSAGRLWTVEHGARGGDEVNRIRKGANYGWPVISYGTHYNGARIGIGTHNPGMEQPAFFWDPSIAPSGLAIYSGRLFPAWRNALLVGSLKFDYIAVLTGDPLAETGFIRGPETGRIRDVREAPDGSIWFLSVDNGAAYRLTPP